MPPSPPPGTSATVARVAVLKRLSSGEEHILTPQYVVGRSAACQLRVPKPQVSSLHAELLWDGSRWLVQDLGSRNGTFVDGTRLSPGERTEIRRGTALAFGDTDDGYTMLDIEPPRLMAVASDERTVVADSNLMSLPSSEDPELTIFENSEGRWVIESNDGRRLAGERETAVADGVSWTVFLPTPSDRTRDVEAQTLSLGTIGLGFFVSRDQEYVSIHISHDQGTTELEPRAHAQLLLALARIRLEDRDNEQLAESERGWVHREQLARDLGIDLSLLNLWVHRARQQLVKAKVRDAGDIVERRPGTLQLRIGVARLSIDNA